MNMNWFTSKNLLFLITQILKESHSKPNFSSFFCFVRLQKKQTKKKTQKARERKGQHGLFSGCSINCSSNLQIIILLYTCMNRCLVSAGENVPLSTRKGFLFVTCKANKTSGIYCFYVR